jgi:four helix bundle protein
MSDKARSIEGLKIYQTSRQLEDAVYELVKALPEEEFYKLGNDLRRSSAAISHYISEAHQRYSYGVKIESLHLARTEADNLNLLLQAHAQRGYGDTKQLIEECTVVIKQAWGLIRYFKQKQDERQANASIKATDELVASRS